MTNYLNDFKYQSVPTSYNTLKLQVAPEIYKYYVVHTCNVWHSVWVNDNPVAEDKDSSVWLGNSGDTLVGVASRTISVGPPDKKHLAHSSFITVHGVLIVFKSVV